MTILEKTYLLKDNLRSLFSIHTANTQHSNFNAHILFSLDERQTKHSSVGYYSPLNFSHFFLLPRKEENKEDLPPLPFFFLDTITRFCFNNSRKSCIIPSSRTNTKASSTGYTHWCLNCVKPLATKSKPSENQRGAMTLLKAGWQN